MNYYIINSKENFDVKKLRLKEKYKVLDKLKRDVMIGRINYEDNVLLLESNLFVVNEYKDNILLLKIEDEDIIEILNDIDNFLYLNLDSLNEMKKELSYSAIVKTMDEVYYLKVLVNNETKILLDGEIKNVDDLMVGEKISLIFSIENLIVYPKQKVAGVKSVARKIEMNRQYKKVMVDNEQLTFTKTNEEIIDDNEIGCLNTILEDNTIGKTEKDEEKSKTIKLCLTGAKKRERGKRTKKISVVIDK